jgi:hypothetical protein
MKPSTLVATAAALAGFASGWLLKPSGGAPAGDGTTAEQVSGKNPVPGSGKSGKRDDRPLVLKPRGGVGGVENLEADPEQASAEHNFKRNFEGATERAENARLSRLAEALGLSPEQRASVEVMLANRRDGFRDVNGGGMKPSEMVAQAAQAERRFEAQIAKILDPEQADAYAAFRAREKENSIEAKAQRDLSDLIGQIDLSSEQRELALEALRAGSSETQARRPEGWTVMNESMSLLGGSQASALEEMAEFIGDDATMGDSRELHRRMLESKRAIMDANLARLASVLTPAQLAQYRATLEARTRFMEQMTPPKYEPR